MSNSRLSILERAEHAGARALVQKAQRFSALFPSKVRREADGAVLHPEIQMLLLLREAVGSVPLSSISVAAARAQIRREARVHAGAEVPLHSVRDLTLTGPGGALKVRHYVPEQGMGPAPLLVFFHGGGFVVGDLDTHDVPCRELARLARVHVLAVDYRLAPEHPFPAAIEDAMFAYRWARENAASLGADTARVAVGGDSAGGNLAAVVALLSAEQKMPLPALQLLIYPSVDRARGRRSLALFADGLFLTRSEVEWYTERYLGSFEDRADRRVSPLLAPSLAGLSPAVVVTAGFDPLRDEGEEYASALRSAGTRCTLFRAHDLVHGFINMGPLSPAAQAALGEVARLVRRELG